MTLATHLQVQLAPPWALVGLGKLRFPLGDEDIEEMENHCVLPCLAPGQLGPSVLLRVFKLRPK